MKKYRCPNARLPGKLYRIHHPESRTTYSENGGFLAADNTKIYNEDSEEEFKQDIVRQFSWDYRGPLPFISLFSGREHAENWGLKEPWQGQRPYPVTKQWTLFTINTEVLEDAVFFSLKELVEDQQVQIPDAAKQHIHGAYICLHRIPAAAINDQTNPNQVLLDRDDRYWERKAAQLDYDYLDGSYDSEREALQENWNTIIEKNIEDAW
ncbi:hypothetical protein M431DRAFT_488731 [Trichoderma harzianum CBS 226.95]|uniref:DUF7587 domain-containing protein n=1 Tax=Trichoderma harzianum CBS 226.95 TaxID=983964 RepID=A0A2T4AS86_TRIHA|nr:hypothetical protein M431DRAFT_488731 [Trichoderma harzianum CBS 226.95]PTB59945.1 hypothetical protein M431DRAFT_488731 [Trichoderma harzianum CBS 226.95]